MRSFIPTRIATLLFATVMAIFGILHFLGAKDMAKMVPIPGGVIWIYFTGAALIGYAIAVFLNHSYEKIAGYLLALMMLVFAVAIHLPDYLSGNTMSMISILKDIALASAAVVVANHADMN